MPRALSSYARQQAYALTSGDAWLVLCTISHPPTSTTYRVVNNTVDIVSRGQTFTAYPFKITLPQETGEGVGSATLQIDNVGLELIDMLRSAVVAPTVTIEVVLSSNMDQVEISIPSLALRQVTWDANTIRGTLLSEDLLSSAWPGYIYDPIEWPGLF